MTAFSKTFAIAAAAGLAFAPIAAQAGTRAESSPVAVDLQRGSAPTSDANGLFGDNDDGGGVLLILALLLFAAAIAAALSGRSRGA